MKYLFLFFIAISVFACKPKPESVNSEEASKIHLEAEAIEANLAGTIDSLIQLRNHLAVQGRELTPEEIAFNNEVTEIETSVSQWRINFPKSAGMEDETATASPKMLALQKEFRDSILAIQKRVAELLQK